MIGGGHHPVQRWGGERKHRSLTPLRVWNDLRKRSEIPDGGGKHGKQQGVDVEGWRVCLLEELTTLDESKRMLSHRLVLGVGRVIQ